MNIRKIGVILLALLLAGMAMVPMVCATEEEKGSLAPALDIRNIQLPKLQFDSTQTKVLVTTEFRLDPDLSSSYRAAVKESSELVDAKIPFGSIIYHSDDGVTTVFDAAGRQLFSADDKRTVKVKTSGKDKPATYFHEVPSGSMILSDPESPDTTFIVDTDNKLVLTVIDKSRNSDIVQDSRALMATQNTVQCNPAGRCTGWFEYAEDNYIPELTRFEAYWATPNRPLTSNMGEKIAIFNSVQPSGNPFILQPVLEWNVNSNNYAWTAAPWYYRSTSDSYYGRRITGVQTNDVIKGNMYYSTINGYPGWWVSIKKNSDPESSIFVTQLSTKTGLNAEVVLEATGLGIDSNYDLPGDVRFYNMIYQKTGALQLQYPLPVMLIPERARGSQD